MLMKCFGGWDVTSIAGDALRENKRNNGNFHKAAL